MDIEARKHIPSAGHEPFLEGVKDCVPTLLGYMSIGFAFGIVGISAQLSIWDIALLSIFIYAGASQFIICALLVTGSPLSAIIFTTFIVNLRHLLLSLTLAPHFTRYSVKQNIGFGLLLTDESFGVAMNKLAQQGKLNNRWMHGLNVTAYLCWIAACTLGGIFGYWISNPEALGLDFALSAMFAALLILSLQTVPKNQLAHRLSLVLYMVVAMFILLHFVPSHVAVLLATVIVATIGVVTDK
ncbi:branched-chain amino acid ABC transporter permease [Bacillus pumilus]|uniref:Branched-chain amino acid ABC transporter permease n=1 Tax=Bacillus pumilus TaxID=1408 RepID=A0A2A5J061_BACPU|nr:AzlC family ABC transporter permease [Bacillus pumilus]PCK22968.1 branched-chain amino acid ABC transporter permease [Bacillus pumilus]